MTNYSNYINGLYIVLYGRTADSGGYNYWLNTQGISAAAAAVTPISPASEQALSQAFVATQSTYFNAQYASLSDTNFILALYNNLGGNTSGVQGAALTYWQNALNAVQGDRAALAGRFTEEFLSYNGTDPAGLTRQASFLNSVAVSQAWVSASASNSFMDAASTTDAAFQAQQAILTGINSNPSTLTTALGQITTAVATQSLTGVIGSPATNFVLTTGADTQTTGFTGGNGATATAAGAVFTANPVTNSFGVQVNTLNNGDVLVDTNAAKDGALNYSAVPPSIFGTNPAFANNVTASGIATVNINNQSGVVAGFQGNVTNVTTLTSQNSTGGVQLGGVGQGVNTPLTNINVNGFAGTNGSLLVGSNLAAAHGSVANKISIAISGTVGGTGATATTSADQIFLGSDNAAAGTTATPDVAYGAWTISNTSTSNLELQQNGVGSTSSLTLSGKGNVAVGSDGAGNWQTLKTIDASGVTGNVVVTGHASSFGSNTDATAANPFGLYGSVAGLLDDGAAAIGNNFALTSFKLGAGSNTLDVSSATIAELTALTTTANAAPAAGSIDKIIVDGTVADTVTTSTFANIAGFTELGVVGINGTINLANLPSAINDIVYQTSAGGAVAITHQANSSSLTIDTEANGFFNTIAVNSAAVLPTSGSLTVIVGNDATVNPGHVGTITAFGETSFTLTANGGGGNDSTGLIALTPSILPTVTPVTANIGGDNDVTVGTFFGAIADVNSAGALQGGELTIKVTDTGVVTFAADVVGGTLLNFATPAGATALAYSNNAVTIDASASGGLITQAGDANFVVAATVALSSGDTITGSIKAGNVLIGSIGNDTIVGTQSSTNADTIVTDGGADKITLAAGHVASDHIDLYAASGATIGGVDATAIINSITDAANVAQLGWWGQATGAAPAVFGTAANATSLNQTTVANFVTGTVSAPQDVLGFSSNAWGHAGIIQGLSDGALTHQAGGVGAVVASVALGQAAAIGAATNVVEINSQTISTASQLQSLLTTGATSLLLSNGALAAGNDAHLLFAYTDGANVHIADVDFFNAAGIAAGAQTSNAGFAVHVSDIVQLTGVASVTSLHAGNFSLVA